MMNQRYRKGSLSAQLAGEDNYSLTDSPYYQQSLSHYQAMPQQQSNGMDMEQMPMMPMGSEYGMFGGSSGATGGATSGGANSLGGASAGSGSGSSGASSMGSLGPVAAIMAAVAASKAVEANNSNNGLGKALGSFNAPSIAQIQADPKTGFTTAAGIPFVNGFIRNKKSAETRPEWESLFG